MPQLSPREVLIKVVDVFASKDRERWAAKAEKLAKDHLKGNEVAIKALGTEVSKAIADLPADRCNELNVWEVAALLTAGEKTALRRLEAYTDPQREDAVKQGKDAKDKEAGYHLHNKALQGAKRFHYHLVPFQEFRKWWEAKHEQEKVRQGVESWQTPKGVRRRQGKQRNEAQRQADILEDAVNLALRDDPELRESLEKIQVLLKKQGLTLGALPAFAGFIEAQVADITTCVTVKQPWLVDGEGQLLDHGWWPIDHSARKIRTVLEAGGTIVEIPLVEAVRSNWKSGDAWFVWAHIAGLAVERWQSDELRQLAKVRSKSAEEHKRYMKPKLDRKRT